jgi:hypothetical protein
MTCKITLESKLNLNENKDFNLIELILKKFNENEEFPFDLSEIISIDLTLEITLKK